MIAEMNWKKFLTEKVLKECWHTIDPRLLHCKCGSKGPSSNHTFDNQDDMLELYRYIYEDGKWNKFFDWSYKKYCNAELGTHKRFTAHLFCLGDEYYEDRCKMVAEFYRWE